MKKLFIALFLLICFTVFSVCVLQSSDRVLHLLNWGEYIDHSLIEEFEELYDCEVDEEPVISSEIMYTKITSGTTPYDVAIPGDYTVRQLYEEGLLLKLDCNNEAYPNMNNYDTMFTDSLKKIMSENMVSNGTDISEYYMPYFWGAYSIIYSTKKADVSSVVKENGFKALYDRSLYNENVYIGMYSTPRWIVASYLMSNGLNPNITKYLALSDYTIGDLDIAIQNDCINALKKVKFDEFGDDQLKRDVAGGKSDMCFTQLGDFFDALYFMYDEEGDNAKIDFNVFVPDTTAAFFDSMVIPKTCKNYELANEFINFMLDKDHAYQNAQAIGYCPTLKSVCDAYLADAEAGAYYYGDENSKVSLSLKEFLEKYPMYLNPLYNSTHVYLLEPKNNMYLTTCETIFNKLASNN